MFQSVAIVSPVKGKIVTVNMGYMYRVFEGTDPFNVNIGIRWRSASSHGSFYPREITLCID